MSNLAQLLARVRPYSKAVIAALVSTLAALSAALTDGEGVSGTEAVTVVVALVVGLGAVWATPRGKAVVGAIVVALTSLGTALTDGTVSDVEWVGIVSQIVVALGAVLVAQNTPTAQPEA